jgi:hypothetical protein
MLLNSLTPLRTTTAACTFLFFREELWISTDAAGEQRLEQVGAGQEHRLERARQQ